MQINSQQEIKKKTKDFIKIYERQQIKKQNHKQKLKSNIMLDIIKKYQCQSKNIIHQYHLYQLYQGKENYGNGNQFGFVGIYGSQNCQLDSKKSYYLECQRSTSVPNVLQNNQTQQNQEYNKAEITCKVPKNSEQYQIYQKGKTQMGIKHKDYSSGQNMDDTQTLRQQKIAHKYKARISKIAQNNQYSQSLQNKNQIKKEEVLMTRKQQNGISLLKQRKNKGLAFDILNDQQKITQNIDEIKRKKIQQLQRKRQLCIQQYRKQQQQKQKQRKTNRSYLKTNKKQIQLYNNQIKSNVKPSMLKSNGNKSKYSQKQYYQQFYIENGKDQSNYKKSSFINNFYQSHCQYQFEGTRNSHSKNNVSKIKTNRMRELSTKNQRNTSKYTQQPKIQPKQRKNTYLRQSNKKLMINALTNVCLPGELNRKQRQKLSEIIQNYQSQFLLFLFKQYSKKLIKAIYRLDISQTYLQKIYGDKIPEIISPDMVQSFYRFDSGAKQFKQLDGCKSFSFAVHAFDLL